MCILYKRGCVICLCFRLLLGCVVICLCMSSHCQTSHCCGLLSGDKEFTVCWLPATYSWFAPSTFHPVSSLVGTALESKCFSTVLNGPWCGPHIPDIFKQSNPFSWPLYNHPRCPRRSLYYMCPLPFLQSTSYFMLSHVLAAAIPSRKVGSYTIV